MKLFLKTIALIGLVVAGHVDADAAAFDSAHERLVRTIESSGVEVVSGVRGQGDGFCSFANGVYEPLEERVTICFEGEVGRWGEKALETLRHEAVHVIQDCRSGMRADGVLHVGLTEEEAYKMVEGVIDLDDRLVPYIMGGADEEVLALEAEAFAVSNTASAGEIADVVSHLCESES